MMTKKEEKSIKSVLAEIMVSEEVESASMAGSAAHTPRLSTPATTWFTNFPVTPSPESDCVNDDVAMVETLMDKDRRLTAVYNLGKPTYNIWIDDKFGTVDQSFVEKAVKRTAYLITKREMWDEDDFYWDDSGLDTVCVVCV